eukprot:m.24185 g.24185  ORF g.24185 m.24185 type:complete len:52 (+) comp8565_c0_seq1:107-262(+)
MQSTKQPLTRVHIEGGMRCEGEEVVIASNFESTLVYLVLRVGTVCGGWLAY